MKVKALSATAIKDFLQCRMKIVFRYDREKDSIRNDHAKIGTAVHKALEQFTLRMANKKSFPDPSDYEFAITCFMNAATEEGLENLDFYSDGRRIVTDFVDKYNPSEDLLAVEHKFRLETPDGIPITGSMDKVIRVNSDTIMIVDYKTARNAATPFELQGDIQLSMYDLAASMLWPQYPNRLLRLDFVRIAKNVNSLRSPDQRLLFRDLLKSVWKQINELDESDVTGRLNSLCGYCDYKSYCREYSKFVQNPDLPLQPLSEISDATFLEHWEEIANKKSILEARQRELKMIAHEKFMRGEAIIGNGKELASTQQSRTNYDIEQVVELIPKEDLLSVLSVNKSRLDRYSKDDLGLKNRLANIAQISYNQPVYKVRVVKGSLPVEEVEDEPTNEDESAA